MEKNLFEGISDKEIIEMLNKKIIKLTTELEELKKEWNKACDILEAFAEDKYYNEGYEQALKDVEKLLDKLPEDAGLWLMEKIDNLKAKGQ